MFNAPKGQPNVAQANGLGSQATTHNQHSIHRTQPSSERAAQHDPTRKTFGHGCDALRRLFSSRAEMGDCLLRGSPFTPRDVWKTSRPIRRTRRVSFAQRTARCSPPRCRGKGYVATPPEQKVLSPFRGFRLLGRDFPRLSCSPKPAGRCPGLRYFAPLGLSPQPG